MAIMNASTGTSEMCGAANGSTTSTAANIIVSVTVRCSPGVGNRSLRPAAPITPSCFICHHRHIPAGRRAQRALVYRARMTAKADFSEAEWASVLEGPPSAGMLVMFAQRGGTFRETFAIAKAYAEARQHHGQSELLDDIVAAKPQMDHSRYHSPEELPRRAWRTSARP